MELSIIEDGKPIDKKYIGNRKFEIKSNNALHFSKTFLWPRCGPKNERMRA
jgi:hypothetical protein